MIAAAVVRQPYSPGVKLPRRAVGLSHCGSRKKTVYSDLNELIYNFNRDCFPSFSFLPHLLLRQSVAVFASMKA